MSAVAINRVHKHYGNLHALRGVDFTIHSGEFFGLLGPNGAGKSTLINVMAGLVRPDSGSVQVMGHDVVTGYRSSRRALGVVPQELVYDPFFTVRELLRLQSGYFGYGPENDPWIDELLVSLGLEDKGNTNMHALSGGMKRRVLIAQAMVHKPPVFVLDEPTAGVDVELRQTLWDFSRRLNDEGHTIILTTHYLEEAETLCDRIAILNKGELTALDSKHALLARQPYRLLVVTVREPEPKFPEQIRRLVVKSEGNLVTFRLHRQREPIGELLDGLKAAGVQVTDLHTDEPSLEEVFRHITAAGGHAGG